MQNTRATLGVHGLPDGLDYYAANLKWQLSIDVSADEIHEIGKREVERVYKEQAKVCTRMLSNNTPL